MKSSRKNGRSRKGSSRVYPLHHSPFFRLERKCDLAKLLKLSPAKLEALIADRNSLYVVREEVVGEKTRLLTVPIRQMRRCHERIFGLLRRIELPAYIRCPRSKSTAWDNAMAHAGGKSITSFDIKAFYPSTTEEHIFRFFRYQAEMSEDCARVLALLCTYGGCLPLGSPMSPHLATLAHLDLFDEAEILAKESANTLTVWVDDIAYSGPATRRDILNAVRRKAKSKGLTVHKIQRGGGRRGVELTGTFLRHQIAAPANSSHLRMKDVAAELAKEESPGQRYRLLNRLTAMARHQRIIVRQNGGRTERLDSRIAYYRRQMKELDPQLTVTVPATVSEKTYPPDNSAPFD